jgi:hypothetical protein
MVNGVSEHGQFALVRSFHLRTAHEIDPIRQFCHRAFWLLDTDRIEVEQPESGLLERGWFGVEGEVMLWA